jgi:hypothetical protein
MEECSICFKSLREKKWSVKTSCCDHFICFGCVVKWNTAEYKYCPYCRYGGDECSSCNLSCENNWRVRTSCCNKIICFRCIEYRYNYCPGCCSGDNYADEDIYASDSEEDEDSTIPEPVNVFVPVLDDNDPEPLFHFKVHKIYDDWPSDLRNQINQSRKLFSYFFENFVFILNHRRFHRMALHKVKEFWDKTNNKDFETWYKVLKLFYDQYSDEDPIFVPIFEESTDNAKADIRSIMRYTPVDEDDKKRNDKELLNIVFKHFKCVLSDKSLHMRIMERIKIYEEEPFKTWHQTLRSFL